MNSLCRIRLNRSSYDRSKNQAVRQPDDGRDDREVRPRRLGAGGCGAGHAFGGSTLGGGRGGEEWVETLQKSPAKLSYDTGKKWYPYLLLI